jgi:hypothetical protein
MKAQFVIPNPSKEALISDAINYVNINKLFS